MERKGARLTVEKKTVIDEGTEFKGSLTATHPVVARGRIEGDLTGPELEVAATGVVVGKAKVTELHSSGELSGTFEAEEATFAASDARAQTTSSTLTGRSHTWPPNPYAALRRAVA